MDGRVYLDASAALKLVLAEPESDSLSDFLRPVASRASSEVLEAELSRALRRRAAMDGLPEELLLDAAVGMLERMDLVTLDRQILGVAGRLDPVGLRTLDALHVASALKVDPLSFFVSYDKRQLEAARSAGLQTASPGAV